MTYLDLINFLNSLPKHQLNNTIQIVTSDNDIVTNVTLTVTNNSDHTDDIPIIIINK